MNTLSKYPIYIVSAHNFKRATFSSRQEDEENTASVHRMLSQQGYTRSKIKGEDESGDLFMLAVKGTIIVAKIAGFIPVLVIRNALAAIGLGSYTLRPFQNHACCNKPGGCVGCTKNHPPSIEGPYNK